VIIHSSKAILTLSPSLVQVSPTSGVFATCLIWKTMMVEENEFQETQCAQLVEKMAKSDDGEEVKIG
jgi:hypothetical protein